MTAPTQALNFIILGLPRSRTAWLAHFLSYGEWLCLHEEARHWRSMEDIKVLAAMPCLGLCETSIAQFWRLIPPGWKVVIVRRPPVEVEASLAKLGCNMSLVRPWLVRQDQKLSQLAVRRPNVVQVQYDEILLESTCKAIFEYCLAKPFDRQWYSRLAHVNIQCDFPRLARYVSAYQPALVRMARLARAATLAGFHRKRRGMGSGSGEISLAVETVERLLSEGGEVFKDHSASVGEDLDSFRGKNIPLMITLEACGNLQTVVARSNGKVFGYLMTLLSPSMEVEGETTAIHTLNYASGEFPGLGLKMQRFAAMQLAGRVNEIVWRCGPRGDGPRSGVLALRQGALPDGEIYRLRLQ